MKWKSYNGQQKLLVVVGACVVIAAFFVLLKVWGINLADGLMGKIFGTALVIALACGILIGVASNIHDEKKDKDNFFN